VIGSRKKKGLRAIDGDSQNLRAALIFAETIPQQPDEAK